MTDTLGRRDLLQAGIAVAADAVSPVAPSGPGQVRIDALTVDDGKIDPAQAVAGGMTAAIVDINIYPRGFAPALEALAQWNTTFRQDRRFLRVTSAAHLAQANAERRLGVILACQDAQVIDVARRSVNDENVGNLNLLFDLGLRVLQLTHNDRNGLGDSYLEPSNAGLSVLGRVVVDEMNKLGMLIDLSHCGDRTTLEAIERSKRPCAITHTGCRALVPSGRNKPDALLKLLARKGGVVGIFNMSNWLTVQPKAKIEHVLDHVKHAVKVCGIDHVGFGSDTSVLGASLDETKALKGLRGFFSRNVGLPGCENMPVHVHVPELSGPDRLVRLAEALGQHGFKSDQVDKLVGGNFSRLLAETMG